VTPEPRGLWPAVNAAAGGTPGRSELNPQIMDAWDHQTSGATTGREAVKAGLTREMTKASRRRSDAVDKGSGERPLPLDVNSADGRPVDQPLPRKPEEVIRATATETQGCEVKTNGARLEISFPGVKAGVFAGRLQYDVFKGSNLIRQVLIAKTDQPSVAFKYDGGLKGLPIQAATRMVWRDLANRWQENRFGGPVKQAPATVWSSNRLIVAELPGGSIAAFPRTVSTGRASLSRTSATAGIEKTAPDLLFGLRQAEKEDDPNISQLRAVQRAPRHLAANAGVPLCQPESGQAAASRRSRLRMTTAQADPGLSVMGDHYHVSVAAARVRGGQSDQRHEAPAIGINIYGIIDGAEGRRGAT
jgi:hypothetical protein